MEALLRSLLLVFMDNATAEYTFVKAFFSYDAAVPTGELSSSVASPTAFLSPDQGIFTEQQSVVGSDYGDQRVRSAGMPSANGRRPEGASAGRSNCTSHTPIKLRA